MTRRTATTFALAALLLATGCRRTAPPPSPGPVDRPWTTADFQRVAAITRCGDLPAFGSAAFARMTAPDALASIDPADQPVSARSGALLDYQDALGAIFKRYTVACGDARAALTLDSALLELNVRALPLMDRFLAGFAPDDPTYAARVRGRQQVADGVVEMATGAEITVRGTDFTAPLPGVGLRLGTALAQVRALLPAGALDGVIGNLGAPTEGDDNPYRRALRVELQTGLHSVPAAPAPTPP